MALQSFVKGEVYEPYVGRWSRLVARDFLAWLDVPEGRRWLDVGCGTGALMQAALAAHAPAEVVGVDPSDGFVAYAATQVTDRRASFRIGDAQALPVEDDEFDAVMSGLVLNFVPDQPAAAREMRRAARPGGTVGAYVWDYAGDMQLMRYFWDVAVELDPEALAVDEGRRFDLCRPPALEELFTGAGFRDVAVEGIVVPTVFRDFDDYWTPFLGGEAPAPSYAMALDEPARARLRDTLRERLPTEPDGSIHLVARAWAVRGTA